MKKKRTFSLIAVVAVLVAGGVYFTTRSAAGQATSTLSANAQTVAVTRTTFGAQTAVISEVRALLPRVVFRQDLP